MTERDDSVSRRYRELPAEEPPRALDEAILAASRRAAGARPAPRAGRLLSRRSPRRPRPLSPTRPVAWNRQ